jgi:hypothetical protein
MREGHAACREQFIRLALDLIEERLKLSLRPLIGALIDRHDEPLALT